MSLALDLLLCFTGWTYVLLAPYTKVEESFNLHAIHDVLMYGTRPSALHNYDHFLFPGVVPRTFVGSVLVAWLTLPVVYVADALGVVTTKFDLQVISRLTLSTINSLGLILLRRAVSRRFGRSTGFFFVLLTCTNLSLYLLVNRAPNSTRPGIWNIRIAIALLTFCAVVFRSELLLLLGPLVLQALVLQHITLLNVIFVGLLSGVISLALTVTVDSYFWRQWLLWPEFAGLYFNVYLGKSSDWGVSPFHTYLTSYLPKLLLGSFPLSFVGAILDPRVRYLLVAPIMFIMLISCLGHKEWRFVVYIVPVFNIAAARAARWLASRRKGTIVGMLMFVATMGIFMANLCATYFLARASIANYPGGEALALFNHKYSSQNFAHVHISNLAAQSGASLFMHEHAPPHFFHTTTPHCWVYNKTESLSPGYLTSSGSLFTHIIAEPEDLVPHEWHVVDSVYGFERWTIDLDILKECGKVYGLLGMATNEKLWILKRDC